MYGVGTSMVMDMEVVSGAGYFTSIVTVRVYSVLSRDCMSGDYRRDKGVNAEQGWVSIANVGDMDGSGVNDLVDLSKMVATLLLDSTSGYD